MSSRALNPKHLLEKGIQGVQNIAKEAADGVGSIATKAGDGVKTIAKGVGDGVGAVAKGAVSGVTEGVGAVGNIANKAGDGVKSLAKGAVSGVGDVGNFFQDRGTMAFNTLLSGAKLDGVFGVEQFKQSVLTLEDLDFEEIAEIELDTEVKRLINETALFSFKILPPPITKRRRQRIATVRVHFRQAKDLLAADSTGKSDPYGIFILAIRSNGEKLYKHKTHKSEYKKQTLTPIWDEHFVYHIKPCEREGATEATLTVMLKDFDNALVSNPLGEVKIDLKHYFVKLGLRKVEEWFPVMYKAKQGEEPQQYGSCLIAISHDDFTTEPTNA